jgi:hypothetical protein
VEIFGRTVVGFLLVLGSADIMQLARQKLDKKVHPDHGGRRRPTAAMVHPPPRRDIPQAAHTLCDKSMLLKLEYLFYITSFLLFKGTGIVGAQCLCLPVVSAAGSGFRPGKNIGNPSLYLWASFPLGRTGAHSDRVPLSLAAEAMLGVFV